MERFLHDPSRGFTITADVAAAEARALRHDWIGRAAPFAGMACPFSMLEATLPWHDVRPNNPNRRDDAGRQPLDVWAARAALMASYPQLDGETPDQYARFCAWISCQRSSGKGDGCWFDPPLGVGVGREWAKRLETCRDVDYRIMGGGDKPGVRHRVTDFLRRILPHLPTVAAAA
jgi:hypothetical protein